ncbi:hypothetical protein HPP92_004771 [Vanilla planifolia]|uniref:Reticulon-like protein n=1 Tax=Vanilla planifolia TaxID=51239 RepID=A0A835RSH9_VANPL|nr:hypothetical protein HPP92_004771 [Vanilla planifolia]
MVAAVVEDSDRSSSTAASLSSTYPNRRRFSVHGALGGGSVADTLLWRNRTAGVSVAVTASVFWILFELVGYSFLSLIANSLILLVFILFFWAKSAALLNRPLPPLPKLEISEEVVARVSEDVRIWINCALSVARDISIKKDRKLFFKVVLLSWIVSYVGSLFSFLTFIYIGVLLALTVPAFYENFQDHIDEKLGMVISFCLKQYEIAHSRISGQSNKKKKIQ